jgi:hypothetical protein
VRHDRLSEDPDLAQAIEDLLPIAHEMRVATSRLLAEPNAAYRRRGKDQIRELNNRIVCRALRVPIDAPALLTILNAILDTKARRGRPAPAGETSRTLLNAATEAVARVETAERAVKVAEAELAAARAHRVTVEEACEAFGIRRIVR